MAQEVVEIVEGWTGPMPFLLRTNGNIADLSAQAMTAEARNRLEQEVDLVAELVVENATGGRVILTPSSEDFTPDGSPYELRFKAVQGGRPIFYPSAEAVQLIVRPWV